MTDDKATRATTDKGESELSDTLEDNDSVTPTLSLPRSLHRRRGHMRLS